METKKIAFLGLGAMGAPMARRLLDPAFELTVWNRSPERSQQFSADGVRVAATAADAADGADVVVTMLSDPAAVQQVISDIAPVLRAGMHVIEASTIGPDAVRKIAELIPPGVALVDAPVMGSTDRASNGSLTLLAGGDIEPVADVLDKFGTVTPCGPVGTGAALKVVLISAVAAGVAAIGEAMAVADAYGLQQDLVTHAMSQSPLAGVADRAFAQSGHFPLRLAAKDVAIALEARELPIARAVHGRLTDTPSVMEGDLGSIVALTRSA